MTDIRWIKVAVDMFDDAKIEFIRSLPEGDSIIVTWIQMLSIAGKSNSNGYLMVMDGIPYTEALLCNKLRRNPVFMQFAIQTLTQLQMVNVEDGPFHITKWEKHQSTDRMEDIKSKGAIRQKNYRERNKTKLLADIVTRDVTNDVTKVEQITSRNETDIEIDLDLKKHIYTFDEIKSFLDRYSVEYGGVYSIEVIQSYGGVLESALILQAIQRSEGKNTGYVMKIIKDMLSDPDKYKDDKPARGSSNIAKTQRAAYRQEPKKNYIDKDVPMYHGPNGGESDH